MSYSADVEMMLSALDRTPTWPGVAGELDRETLGAILTEAARLAEEQLAPLNRTMDRVGARFENGAVILPPECHPVFEALATGGWLALEHDPDLGGMGMPLAVLASVIPLFDRACPALMMCATASRSAALLLTEFAAPALREDWVPALTSGARTATICISEPEAGSDLGRIRTRAERDSDTWRVTGQKIWISFGAHDLRDRIGHCLLARTGAEPGTRGLSLFFVETGGGLACQRIEEKMGLHGSPTCALQFDDAPASLLGAEGRGLPQLFTMIRHMRLSVGMQGLGTALGSLAIARDHAEARRQGGKPTAPPVPILTHPDVRRQIRSLTARIDLFRLALLEAACAADLSAADPDMARLTAWLLPLIKTFGAELGFQAASDAIQVLGGAGVTRDYAAEQYLRDSRVFAIYEGTTGMQAQDFLLRQSLADECVAIEVFLSRARSECDGPALDVVERFGAFARAMAAAPRPQQLGGADGFLRAGWIAVQAWLSARLDGPDAAFFLATAGQEMALWIARTEAGDGGEI